MLESVLKCTSHSFGRCALHISDEPRECISVNGKTISHYDFAESIKNISKAYKSKFKDSTPCRSEVLTLAAVICFASNGCEIALFERDAQKNDPASIIDAPTVSLLTPFSEREYRAADLSILSQRVLQKRSQALNTRRSLTLCQALAFFREADLPCRYTAIWRSKA